MKQPLLSVVIPVYDRENQLIRCIESVIYQSYRNFQLILVDDGSPDNCGQICDVYAGKDSRIIVIHKRNGGVASARNAGLDVANGEWIYFLDADDYLKLEAFESIITKADETNADLVFFDSLEIRCGKLKTKHALNGEQEYYNTLDEIETLKIFSKTVGSIWSFAVRTAVVKGVIQFREDVYYADDEIFKLECYPHISSFAYIKRVLHYYCWSDTSYSHMHHGFEVDMLHKEACARMELLDKYGYPDGALMLFNGKCINSVFRMATYIFNKKNKIAFSQKVCQCNDVLLLETTQNAFKNYDKDALHGKSTKTLMAVKNPSSLWVCFVIFLNRLKICVSNVSISWKKPC